MILLRIGSFLGLAKRKDGIITINIYLSIVIHMK